MAKTSFKRNLEQLVFSQMQELGWRRKEHIIFQIVEGDLLVAVSLWGGSMTALMGEPGYLFYPEIFISDPKIELQYERMQSEIGKIMFARSAGTVMAPISWIRLGAPKIFALSVPILATDYCHVMTAESIAPIWPEVLRHILSDYYFTVRECEDDKLFHRWGGLIRSVTDPPLTSESMTKAKIDAMCKDVEDGLSFFTRMYSSPTALVELAATEPDINNAVLFGPLWPYKVPFILLMSNRVEEATRFNDFLTKMQWWLAFNIGQNAATSKLENLFEWCLQNNGTDVRSPETAESFTDTTIDKLITLTRPDKEAKKRGAALNTMVIPLCIPLLGLPGELDRELFERHCSLNKIPL